MKTVIKSNRFWMRKAMSIKPTWIIPSLRQRKMLATPSSVLHYRNFAKCRTSVSVTNLRGFKDKNDMETFYDALNEVCGPTSSGSSHMLSANGNTFITEKKILER